LLGFLSQGERAHDIPQRGRSVATTDRTVKDRKLPGSPGPTTLRSTEDALRETDEPTTHPQPDDPVGTVLDLAVELATNEDLPALLQQVVGRLADAAGVDRCSLALLDRAVRVGEELPSAFTVVAASDRAGALSLSLRMADYPEVARALSTAAPVIVADAARDPLMHAVREAIERVGVGALAVFPLRVGRELTGVLLLRSRRPFEGPGPVSLGRSAAAAAALAVRQAALVEDARRASLRIARSQAELIEHLPDGVALLDDSLNVELLNPAGCRLLGVTNVAAKGRGFFSLAAPVDGLAEHLVRRDLATGGRILGSDLEVRLADGRRAAFSISAGHVGRDGRMVLSFRDVTERHRVESELRRTRDFLERVIDSSSDAIVAADMSGRVLIFNRAAESLFALPVGSARDELSMSDLYPHGGGDEIMRLLHESPRGQIEAVRSYGRQSSGELVPVELSASLVRVDGTDLATVCLLRDLRERVRVEKELAGTRQRLVEAEKQAAITALAGAAAHELNQPLTVVTASIELLRKRVDESQRARLETVLAEAQRMADIVRTIAKLTRVETRPYVNDRVIADFERSLAPDEGPPTESRPPTSTPTGSG